jgi:hypothetical protein
MHGKRLFVTHVCGSMLAAWRQVLPVVIEHGVRDVPHAMMLLVRTFVLPGVLYACQFWGPDMLQLSHCGQSSVQFELLSICKRFLGLRGSVAQVSLVDELGLQPLEIIWLKSVCKTLRHCLHCFQRQSVAMGGYASKCGAVAGMSQGLVCMASLVSHV